MSGLPEVALARYKQIMERNRWAVVGVMPWQPKDPPPWCYTVGLTQYEYPELVITGLPPDVAQPILNRFAQRLLDDFDFDPSLGDELDDVLKGCAVKLGDVSAANVARYLKVAVYLMPTAVRAVQIVWPGRDGEWPWMSDALAEQQAVLAEVER